jgi:hypothetical protein
MTVTVWPARENLQSFSALWRFEQGQAGHQAFVDLMAPAPRSTGSGAL